VVPSPAGALLQHSAALPLGVCPACGDEVPPGPDALRYDGDFHHLACALLLREQTLRYGPGQWLLH
jgi:hypothetical protein